MTHQPGMIETAVAHDTDPGTQFIAALMDQQARSDQSISNNLIAYWKNVAEESTATLKAIRDRIYCLIDSDYAPSTKAIENALWPPELLVDVYRKASDDQPK